MGKVWKTRLDHVRNEAVEVGTVWKTRLENV